MSDTWQVEARMNHHANWNVQVDRLDRQIAGETAEFYAGRYPHWTLRLQDVATGEVVHLDHDGKPLPVDTTVMRRDTRSPEQVRADVLADRYEASLERGRDL